MQQTSIHLVMVTLALTYLPPAAFADTLDLNCTTSGAAQPFRLVIDLTTGHVSHYASVFRMNWAALVTDKEVSWDETGDVGPFHSINHYVFDRQSGQLRVADTTRGRNGPETFNAVCRK